VKLFEKKLNKTTVGNFEFISDNQNGFYSYDGQLYQSDLVRSSIRPIVSAVGKSVSKHIFEQVKDGVKDIQVNPQTYIRFLLEEPNPYMTGQLLQEKLTTQLLLNNNAFAFIQRNNNGLPIAIYPIVAYNCEAIKSNGELFMTFYLKRNDANSIVTFRYTDLIHLRRDFNENEIFGSSPATTLVPLMEIVTTTDQGIVKAIKNSNMVNWLLKYNSQLKDEHLTKSVKTFIDNFLSNSSETVGAIGADAKFDVTQIKPNDYVPNASQMDRTKERIYSFFNTNEKIVQSKFNEDEWISFYESCVEPIILQLSNEYTRKIFTRKERIDGNYIMFEASNLGYASTQTKLAFMGMVDRGSMVPNEWRKLFNWAPIDGGDEPIRRLDTRPITE